MDRIKYFTINDLATSIYYNRITKLILEFNSEKNNSILDILEYNNLIKYIDAGIQIENIQSSQMKEIRKNFTA